LSDEETARYREIYLKNDPGKEALMGLTQILREEGWREGQREGLIEGIELALSLKFGDESRHLAERIAQIQDIQRLKAVKEIIRSAADAEDFRRRLEQ
jgi:predicted transposase YdaD